MATSRLAFVIENSSQGGSLVKTQKAREEANQAVDIVNKVFIDVEEFGPAEHKAVLKLLELTKQFADSI